MPHDIGNPGATIKNPPAVFARQANIAHGPQQVNNNGMMPASEPRAVLTSRPLVGGISQEAKIKTYQPVVRTEKLAVWLRRPARLYGQH
ncbi:MAG: hypothetical protein M3495_06785 [Pseudomonadota bacterium]|nr:hypothetical protein [Pseudomonadota bacterium]